MGTRSEKSITVKTAAQLVKAVGSCPSEIVIEGKISGSPSITLPEGTTLRGGQLIFKAKGVRLTGNNTLKDITIKTVPYEVAVYNDTSVRDAGVLRFENVNTEGQIYLIADDETIHIRVEIEDLYVTNADVRGRIEQPHAFGVDVLQGGLTLWNRQKDPLSTFSATLLNVSVGTAETPVRGSGVFVAGCADRKGNLTGGALTADIIQTGVIVTDGGIAQGTPDKISGGVFVSSGAEVDKIENKGTATTHGQNDMVLDNWGHVKVWTAYSQITSTGPSGIGFVNFGDIDTLDIQAPILTTGAGARGFNLYEGSLSKAKFHSIKTTGDGSIGIQISKPLDSLIVQNDIETTGGEGMSLVKGVQMKLKATALSVKSGGNINLITIGGSLITRGDEVVTFEVSENATVHSMTVGGTIEASGKDSVPTAIIGTAPHLEF